MEKEKEKKKECTHRNGKIRGYSTCLRFNYFRFLLRVGYNWLFLLCLKISLMMGQQVQWPFSSVRVDSLLLTSGCMYSYSQSAACEALSQLLTKLSSQNIPSVVKPTSGDIFERVRQLVRQLCSFSNPQLSTLNRVSHKQLCLSSSFSNPYSSRL